MEIKQEFPNIRLIIAHIGRAYTREDVGNAFETLDKAPDLMYDFCANCCEYAITEVLRHAGPKHVMYGTEDVYKRQVCARAPRSPRCSTTWTS